MEENKQSKLEQFLAGKGFYIVLALCIVVIGISVWSIMTHSVAKNVSIEPDISLEERVGEDTAPVMNETEPESKTEPVIEEIDTENAEETGVYTEGEEYSEPAAWVWPVEGEVSREYSIDALKYDVTMDDWRTHEGLDIAANQGDAIRAVSDGTVSSVENDELYGTTVTIDHGAGVTSVYSNLEDTPPVAAGSSVKAGDTIGAVGKTAICEANQPAHVHIEVFKDGNSVDPLSCLPG